MINVWVDSTNFRIKAASWRNALSNIGMSRGRRRKTKIDWDVNSHHSRHNGSARRSVFVEYACAIADESRLLWKLPISGAIKPCYGRKVGQSERRSRESSISFMNSKWFVKNYWWLTMTEVRVIIKSNQLLFKRSWAETCLSTRLAIGSHLSFEFVHLLVSLSLDLRRCTKI